MKAGIGMSGGYCNRNLSSSPVFGGALVLFTEGVGGSGEGGAGKEEGIDECVRETKIFLPTPNF